MQAKKHLSEMIDNALLTPPRQLPIANRAHIWDNASIPRSDDAGIFFMEQPEERRQNVVSTFTDHLRHLINKIFSLRWLASILLLVTLDVATWLAFKDSGGPPAFMHQDKVMHILGFFGLSVLGYLCMNFDFFPRQHSCSIKLHVINWFLWIGYGVFIEMVQSLLSHRSASLADLMADLAGIAIGTITICLLRLYPEPGAPREA